MTGKKNVGMNYQHYITKEKLVETVNTSGLPMCDIVGILRELLRQAETEYARLVGFEKTEAEKEAADAGTNHESNAGTNA